MRIALLALLVATIGCAAESDPDARADDAADASAEVLQLAGPCEPCTNDRECDYGLACDRPKTWVCKTPSQISDSDPDCENVDCPNCETDGACHIAVKGDYAWCTPLGPADCEGSTGCTDPGRHKPRCTFYPNQAPGEPGGACSQAPD